MRRRRCSHCVSASVASTVAIAVNVSCLVCLVAAFALVPMLVCIGYPSRAVCVSMRRRRYAHSVSASVARAVVITVVVSCLFKLLTVATRAFVPVVSFVLLPFGFRSVSDMSGCRSDYESTNRTGFGRILGCRTGRSMSHLRIGYGTAFGFANVPMSACVLLPFAGKVVSNSPYVTASTVGIAIVIETMFCGTYLFAFTSDALEPVSVCVIAVYTV